MGDERTDIGRYMNQKLSRNPFVIIMGGIYSIGHYVYEGMEKAYDFVRGGESKLESVDTDKRR